MNGQIINQDCIKYLNSQFCPMFDMMFGDPPFNIGQTYDGFSDVMFEEEYDNFTADWIRAYWNKLKPGGAMILHGSTSVARRITRHLWELNLERHIETEIVWFFKFAQCNFSNLLQTNTRALVVRKPGKNKNWNVENSMVPSQRLLQGDKRVTTSRYKGMVPHGTVWGIDNDHDNTEPLNSAANWGRVQGNNTERRKQHPNQLPEKYLERIILLYSKVGNLIFDGFGGSGTTFVVGEALQRHVITTDISENNCQSIAKRAEIGTKTVKPLAKIDENGFPTLNS